MRKWRDFGGTIYWVLPIEVKPHEKCRVGMHFSNTPSYDLAYRIIGKRIKLRYRYRSIANDYLRAMVLFAGRRIKQMIFFSVSVCCIINVSNRISYFDSYLFYPDVLSIGHSGPKLKCNCQSFSSGVNVVMQYNLWIFCVCLFPINGATIFVTIKKNTPIQDTKLTLWRAHMVNMRFFYMWHLLCWNWNISGKLGQYHGCLCTDSLHR